MTLLAAAFRASPPAQSSAASSFAWLALIVGLTAAPRAARAHGNADSRPSVASETARGVAGDYRLMLDRWVAACRREADDSTRPSSDELQRARQAAQRDLSAFLSASPALQSATAGWGKFLLLADARKLVAGEELPSHALDELEARWLNALTAWNHPALARVSRSIRACIVLVRANAAASAPRAAEERRREWLEIAELIDKLATRSPLEVQRLETKLGQRAALGQGLDLVAEIRAQNLGPNLVMVAPARWLERELSDRVDEGFEVRGTYAGARSTGRGTISGDVFGAYRPTATGAELAVHFVGVARSRSASSSRGVRVSSHATTHFTAQKRFVVDAWGVSTLPATATASTQLTYDRVSASGGPIRRRRATDAAYATRGRARRDAEAEVRRSVIERLDREGAAWAARFNGSLADFRNDVFSLPRTVLDVRVRGERDALRWECRIAGVGRVPFFGSPHATPSTADGWTVLVAASALSHRANALLEDRTVSGDRLRQVLGGSTSGPAPPVAPSTASTPNLMAAFGATPCFVSLYDDKVRTMLHIDKLVADGVTYPPLSVEFDFRLGRDRGAISLSRPDKPRVQILPATGGGPRTTGRATALRIAVERKLDRSLARTTAWPEWRLPVGDAGQSSATTQVATDHNWLVVVYGAEAARGATASAAAVQASR